MVIRRHTWHSPAASRANKKVAPRQKSAMAEMIGPGSCSSACGVATHQYNMVHRQREMLNFLCTGECGPTCHRERKGRTQGKKKRVLEKQQE
jgi:hypothetical protein